MFGKNTKRQKRYSIKEKIDYFNNVLKNRNSSKKRIDWANKRLTHLNDLLNNMKIGDVYVAHDNLFGNTSKKPRLVVIGKVSNHNVKIIPVDKEKKIMSLSQFDNNRSISMNNAVDVNKGILYEKRGFKISKNAFLTLKEKVKLQNKSDKYL